METKPKHRKQLELELVKAMYTGDEDKINRLIEALKPSGQLHLVPAQKKEEERGFGTITSDKLPSRKNVMAEVSVYMRNSIGRLFQ